MQRPTETPCPAESSIGVEKAEAGNGTIGLELCFDERRGSPLILPLLVAGKKR